MLIEFQRLNLSLFAEKDKNDIMTDYEKIWCFQNLYEAHKKARLGKRNTKEVIDFEMNLGKNLTELSESIKNKTYKTGGYYEFTVYDPKVRLIHALRYKDRVVQHCLCDNVLEPILEKRLIYDNAACRIGKGTHFAINRLSGFFRDYYKCNKEQGYVLKCDIKKFFDSIDHTVLKEKLSKVIHDTDVLYMLYEIIDRYPCWARTKLPLNDKSLSLRPSFVLKGFYLPAPKSEQIL